MKAPLQVDRPPQKWEPPDREWLERKILVEGESARSIAKSLGCSDWVVQQWVKKARLREPRRISVDPDAPRKVGHGRGAGVRFVGITKGWLKRQYVELDKSSHDIADELGTSANAVCRWLKTHGIPLRTDEQRAERHSERMSGEGNPAWNGGTAQRYQKRILLESDRLRRCEWCGTTKRLYMHHRNHDREDGRLENLTWLCRWCNSFEGWFHRLEKEGRLRWSIDLEGHELTIQFMYGGKQT